MKRWLGLAFLLGLLCELLYLALGWDLESWQPTKASRAEVPGDWTGGGTEL